MKAFLLASVLALAGVAVAFTGSAEAHEPGRGYGFGRYGVGRHDVVPHWHRTRTPYGSVHWYGSGSHDYYPHAHRATPYGVRSYSITPYGPTTSYHPYRYHGGYPYYGGYDGYRSHYGYGW